MARAGKASGKGVGNAVQNASALRAGGKGKKSGGIPSHAKIENASQLRSQFAEIQHSPDGADPQPLTVPKCVECAHCGWPVYCRDARVATRKTFEKAGIAREYAEKTVAPKKEAAAAGAAKAEEEDLDLGDEDSDDEKDGAGSDDTIGTQEMLENKVQELEERIMELESLNENLEKENAELTQQVEDLEESLAAAEEKIELLEESEMRWREKNSVLRTQNEDLRVYINQLGNRIGDLETDMVSKLLEIRWRKEEAARKERRRALMLTGLEGAMRKFEGEGLVKAMFKVWQEKTAIENRRRETQEAEEMRRLQVGELRHQLGQEKHHNLSLEATALRLRGSLKAAAHRMLGKVMSTTQKPWADGHVLRAWAGLHPALKFENELIRTQKELAETQTKLREEEATTARLTTELDETSASLKKISKEHDELTDNYATVLGELQQMLGAQNQQASDIQRMAEEKAKKAREALCEEVWAEANKKMDEMNIDFEKERVDFQDEIGGLEAQLEAIKRGIGMAAGNNDDETRVVPKGQGILCVGCLRQIVNRGVKQLPPVSMPRAKSPPRNEDKTRRSFFKQELQGMPDADDMLHSEFWKSRRDPMAGLRYADLCDSSESVHTPKKSVMSRSFSSESPPKALSQSRLTPIRMKETLKFKPTHFR